MRIKEILQELCALPAVSGFEASAAEQIKDLFAPYCQKITVDSFGNVLGYRFCGKPNAKTVLLDAHIDQIGFIVTDVLEGGFLRFAPVGGVDPRMLLGNEVTILAEEPLYGVIACMPPHLLKAEDKNKAVPITQMLIDTGLLDAKGKIPIGTPVVFSPRPARLLSTNTWASCSIDDRAGITAILTALEALQGADLACDIAVLVSVQEEVTGLGAQTGAFALHPDFGIAVDVTHGKTPDGPSDGVFELGGGAVIGMGPNCHRGLTKRLLKTAKAEDIPYQVEVMEGNTGTNAWTIQIVAHGIATALLSIPLKYMHTPIELLRLSDVEAVANLIAAFLREFHGEV